MDHVQVLVDEGGEGGGGHTLKVWVALGRDRAARTGNIMVGLLVRLVGEVSLL